VSVKDKNKARVLLELTRIISESSETEVQEFRGSEWGQVDNENENQSQYSNMSNNHMKRSLIYGVREDSINQEDWECGKCEGQG